MILGEALSNGFEEGIIDGTGKEMPIGMNWQVGTGVVVTDGVYPLKNTVPVTALDPVSYGNLISGMAVGPNGKTRIERGYIFRTSSTNGIINMTKHLSLIGEGYFLLQPFVRHCLSIYYAIFRIIELRK